jgi:hypothetical protein
MYCTDPSARETLFLFPEQGTVRSATLEMIANCKQLRAPMQRSIHAWVAWLKLPDGWCFYHFEVNGRTQWNRAIGKMKTYDVRPSNLAMFSTSLKSTN